MKKGSVSVPANEWAEYQEWRDYRAWRSWAWLLIGIEENNCEYDARIEEGFTFLKMRLQRQKGASLSKKELVLYRTAYEEGILEGFSCAAERTAKALEENAIKEASEEADG